MVKVAVPSESIEHLAEKAEEQAPTEQPVVSPGQNVFGAVAEASSVSDLPALTADESAQSSEMQPLAASVPPAVESDVTPGGLIVPGASELGNLDDAMPPSTAGETPSATHAQVEFEWLLEQHAPPALSSSAAELVAALELLEESVAAAKAPSKHPQSTASHIDPATLIQPELALFSLDIGTAENVLSMDQQAKAPIEPDLEAETGLAAVFHTETTKISHNGSGSLPDLEVPSGGKEQADSSSKPAPQTESEILATSEPETTPGRAMTPEKPCDPSVDAEESGEKDLNRGLTPNRAAEDDRSLARPEATDRLDTEAPEVRWTVDPGSRIETNTKMPSVPDRPPRRRVLAIDDDPTMRKLLKLGLAPHNYECVTAENGLAAQEVLKSHRADLILVDLLMPVMDGLAFLQWLRETAKDPTPVIVFTNANDPKVTQAALRSGANSFASKPLHLKELLQAMKQLVPA